MTDEWDGKIVMSTPGGPIVTLSLGEVLARKDAEIEKQRAEIEGLTRERDEARYFLKIFIHAHASNNAVPPHIEQQARKALEGKP